MTQASGKPERYILPVPIGADTRGLSPNDQEVLGHLIKAVKSMGKVSDKQRGTNLYPANLTKEEFGAYLSLHPEKEEWLLNPFAVIQWRGKALVPVPYSQVYRRELLEVVAHLTAAADLVTHEAFQRFLRGKIMACLTNDYPRSDREWIQCLGAPFELILGPYESDADSFWGVKRFFEGTVGIVRQDMQQMLDAYQNRAVEFNAFLGKRYGYSLLTKRAPITMIDEVLAVGDPIVTMGSNLPNDQDIREEVGSKRTLFSNIIVAQYQSLVAPILQHAIEGYDTAVLNLEAYVRFIQAHEVCHGGVAFRFQAANFKPHSFGLEEGKADVFGVLFLADQADAEKYAVLCIADAIREIRRDGEEAHGQGSIIKLSWLLETGAIRIEHGKIVVARERLIDAFWELGNALYELSQTRSSDRAREFIDRWGSMPAELATVIGSMPRIPVNIGPVFAV